MHHSSTGRGPAAGNLASAASRSARIRRVVDGQAERRCPGCRRWLPDSSDHFHRQRDRLQSYCKRCAGQAAATARAAKRRHPADPRHMAPKPPRTAPSPRELEVLLARMREGSNKAAAHVLGISLQTVKNHLSTTYALLGVEGIGQAAWVLWVRDAVEGGER